MPRKSRFRVNPLLDEMVDFLFGVRKSLIDDGGEPHFDFPEYGGLPKKIFSRLGSDSVDRIQDSLPRLIRTKSKKAFVKEIVPLVIQDFVK